MMSFARLLPRWGWIAVLLLGSILLAALACGDEEGGGGGGQTPPAGETPSEGGATSAEIKMVPTIKFDKTELTIAADTDVEITADNAENGVPHNFAVYEDQAYETSIDKTEVCPGPCTETLTLNLQAGEYYFRCDVHPTTMEGTLTVE